MKERNINIDVLRGTAILLVFLGHAIVVYPIDLHEIGWCNWLFILVSSVHMPIFFSVSGYCFSNKAGYFTHLQKKVVRILIPYLIFNIYEMVPRTLFPQLVNRDKSLYEWFVSMLLHGGGSWFLYTLFVLFLIFPLIAKIMEKNLPCAVAVLATSILIYYFIPRIYYFKLNEVVEYLPFFTGGYLLQLCRVRYMSTYETIRNIATGKLCIIFASVMWMPVMIAAEVTVKYDPFAKVASVLGIVVVYNIITEFNEKLQKVFAVLGKYSLQFYLLNGSLLVISRTAIVSVLKVENPMLIISFNFVFCVTFAYIISRYILDSNHLFRFLSGIPCQKAVSKQEYQHTDNRA